MAKGLHCRDVGFDCGAVVVADTGEEVVAQAAAHAHEVHGLSDEQISDADFAAKVTAEIHEQTQA